MASLTEFKTQFDAFRSTEPGKYASQIGDLLYDHSNALGPEWMKKMQDVRAYLETLAWREVDEQIPAWVKAMSQEPKR